MADMKMLIVICAAVCMAQALPSSHSLSKRSIASDLRDAELKTVYFVGNVSQTVKNAVDNATKVLDGYLHFANTTANEFLNGIQTKIKAISDEALAKSQTSVPACALEMGKAVGEVAAQTLFNIAKCATDKVQQFANLLDTVVHLGNDGLTLVPEALIAIKDCVEKPLILNRVVCVTGVGVVKGLEAAAIVGRVTNAVATGTALVTTIQADLATCATTRLAAFAIDAGKTVATFASCSLGTLG